MRTPEDIILAPIVTEKSTTVSAEGKYTFRVNPTATKIEIKNAVEKLFNVKVLRVNTMNLFGKNKRVGVHAGKTADWKKAIVQIDLDPQAISYLGKGGKDEIVNKKYKTSIEEFGFVQ